MDYGASSYLRFLDGDDEGIVAIIKLYKDGLILYLDSFTHDMYEAEDLMEDTFVKLAIKKPVFHGRSSFKTFLYSIARNVAIDRIRKARKSDSLDTMEFASDYSDLEQIYLKSESRIAVHKALKNLKPEYSQVLYLVFFENFSNAEAAKIMHRNKRQIENLIYRAKRSLKAELIKEGFVYEKL